MQENGLLENTYLIFTSDHGEMFERGIWGHYTPAMYESLLHIPLLIWGPGIEQRQDITLPTSTTDILPTLLQIAGQQPATWDEGQPLPGFGDQPPNPERSVFSVDAKESPWRGQLETASISLHKGQYKMTYYTGYSGIEDFYELYNLEEDPDEVNNLYPAQPAESAAMQEEILTIIAEKNTVR
jgi:arylsulfatase A-like enzyme